MIEFDDLVFVFVLIFLFFCKQKTAYEMRISDWSSDVCSSDLTEPADDRHRRIDQHVGRTGGARNARAADDVGIAAFESRLRHRLPIAVEESLIERDRKSVV